MEAEAWRKMRTFVVQSLRNISEYYRNQHINGPNNNRSWHLRFPFNGSYECSQSYVSRNLFGLAMRFRQSVVERRLCRFARYVNSLLFDLLSVQSEAQLMKQSYG
jgi:hypothetical protein